MPRQTIVLVRRSDRRRLPNASGQRPGPPAETTTLESREVGPGSAEGGQRVVRRGGPSRSTTAELIRVKRHKFPDAHRRAVRSAFSAFLLARRSFPISFAPRRAEGPHVISGTIAGSSFSP